MLRIAIFASGKGSNVRAILDAIRDGRIQQAEIVVVISNNSDAGALEIARSHGIPARHLSRRQFDSDSAFDDALLSLLRDMKVTLIVLAGYMKKVSDAIIAAYRNHIINIHPALLPAFGGQGMYGMRVHEAVIASGATESGATVHLVDETYDHGAILLQRKVPVDPADTPASLAAKVLAVEHVLYPEAIRLIAERESASGVHRNGMAAR